MRLTANVPIAKLCGIYKRMETDAEYVRRLFDAGKISGPQLYATGRALDTLGDSFGMQRRIVESST